MFNSRVFSGACMSVCVSHFPQCIS